MNEKLTAWVWQQDCQPEDKLTMLAIVKAGHMASVSATDLRDIQKLTASTEEEVKNSIGRLDFLDLVRFEGSLVRLAGVGVL